MLKNVVTTVGGIVAPGLVADLVVSWRDEIELIWFNGEQFYRGVELEYDGTLYRLGSLPDGIQHLTRFARGVKEYYPERALLADLSYLLQPYAHLTEENSKLQGACAMATWIPEIISGSFTWYVVSPLPMQAMNTLQALCRRPIRDSRFISEFPPGQRPTLLSWAPENVTPDTFQAIFPGRDAYEADSVSTKDLGIVKPFEDPILTNSLQTEMAEDLQDCLQFFRLQHLHFWSLTGKVPSISPRVLRWKIDNFSAGTADSLRSYSPPYQKGCTVHFSPCRAWMLMGRIGCNRDGQSSLKLMRGATWYRTKGPAPLQSRKNPRKVLNVMAAEFSMCAARPNTAVRRTAAESDHGQEIQGKRK